MIIRFCCCAFCSLKLLIKRKFVHAPLRKGNELMNALEVWDHETTFKLNMMMSHLRTAARTGFATLSSGSSISFGMSRPTLMSPGFAQWARLSWSLPSSWRKLTCDRPNPLFDPVWDVETYPDVARFSGPLSHYLLHGEAGVAAPAV